MYAPRKSSLFEHSYINNGFKLPCFCYFILFHCGGYVMYNNNDNIIRYYYYYYKYYKPCLSQTVIYFDGGGVSVDEFQFVDIIL